MDGCGQSRTTDLAPRSRFRFHSFHTESLLEFRGPRPVIPRFNRFDGIVERPYQHALADAPEHQAERPSSEVLAVTYDDSVDVGLPVRPPRESVSVARGAAPQVGVGGRHHDAVWIGPVVVQSLPDATRALGDVGLRGAPM